MSWDVMILNTRGETPPLEELQEGNCDQLGPANEVRRRISAHLPEVNWSDPSWGLYNGDGFSIEFSIGSADTVRDMMLHVRGGGDSISAIAKFVRPEGWSALDISEGGFLDLANPSQEGWQAFQEFRDKVVEQITAEDKP